MSEKMKKIKDFQKVYSKNDLVIKSVLLLKNDLLMSAISDIRKKFEINRDLPTINPMEHQNQYGNLIKQGSQKMKTFHERIGSKASDFYTDLGKITKQLHLGREWITPLEKFAVSGIFLPPPFSVLVDVNENEKIILFEINKNTTQDDLILAWKKIKYIRKKMYGKVRASFPIEKTIKNFNRCAEAMEIKSKMPVEEYYDGNENTTKKYKMTDSIVVSKIFSEEKDESIETDLKRLNKLRVNRFRFKKITS